MKCARCLGTGKVPDQSEVLRLYKKCPECGGSGRNE
jgi:DnaJ-class molecular chaperone